MSVMLETSEDAWGDGTHPSTALCLDFLAQRGFGPEDHLLDFGCGSGVLAMAALRLGCPSATGVDVDDEVLACAERNRLINNITNIDFQHVRSVVPGESPAATVVVANILVGQLSRPSMIATLALATEPGAHLCLSGFRPGDQTETLRKLYEPYFDFDMEKYAEAKPDAHGQEYWGTWARLVARRRDLRHNSQKQLLTDLSEAALG